MTEVADDVGHSLLVTRLDVLWRRDAQGRMIETNEPQPEPAPRLYIGQTAVSAVCCTGWQLQPEVGEALLRLAPGRLVSDERLVMEILSREAPCTRIWRGPAFSFAAPVAGDSFPQARLLSASDESALKRAGFDSDLLAHWGPVCGAVIDGEIRAICFSSRISAKADEAGVETVLAWQGQGYGRQAVLVWAHAVQVQGKLALYSTSWDNVASRALAESLGLWRFGEDVGYY